MRELQLHHGEHILDHVSPPGSPGTGTECDPSLLDVDSDNPEGEEKSEAVNNDAEMIVDNVGSCVNEILDPLYLQCKNC
jgi:hypothetical protein